MPILFPTSPTVGQVFTEAGRSWVWSGATWDSPSGRNQTAMPVGGTTGQMLTKASNLDYETQWSPRAASATGTMGYQIINTGEQAWINISLTCSGRPVVVAYTGVYANLASGANRLVYFKARMDGSNIGIGTSAFAELQGNNGETMGETILLTPSAGSHTFSFVASASNNISVGIYVASLVVFEI